MTDFEAWMDDVIEAEYEQGPNYRTTSGKEKMTAKQTTENDNNPFGFKLPSYDNFLKKIKNVNWKEVEQLYNGIKALFEEGKAGYQTFCSSYNKKGKPCSQHSKYDAGSELKAFVTKLFSDAPSEQPVGVAESIDDLAQHGQGLGDNEQQKVAHAEIATKAYRALDQMPKDGYAQTRAFIEVFAKYHADRAVGKEKGEK